MGYQIPQLNAFKNGSTPRYTVAINYIVINNSLDTSEEPSSLQADNVSSEEESEQEGDETGRLLRATVDELQKALENSRQILSERDAELEKLRNELEQHRKQVTII